MSARPRPDAPAKIVHLYEVLRPGAERLFGPYWINPLAQAAGWPTTTLRTLFSRGQRLPPGDQLRQLLRAAGVEGDAGLFATAGEQTIERTSTAHQQLDALLAHVRHSFRPLMLNRQSDKDARAMQKRLYEQIEFLAEWYQFRRRRSTPRRRGSTAKSRHRSATGGAA